MYRLAGRFFLASAFNICSFSATDNFATSGQIPDTALFSLLSRLFPSG